MKPNLRPILLLGFLAFCGLVGGWLIRGLRAATVPVTVESHALVVSPKASREIRRTVPRASRAEFRDGTTVELFASSKPDEIILRFPS